MPVPVNTVVEAPETAAAVRFNTGFNRVAPSTDDVGEVKELVVPLAEIRNGCSATVEPT